MARDDAQVAPAAPPKTDRRRRIASLALTLVLGAAGGAVFNYLTLPLAWMLGSMTAVTVGTLCGLRLFIPRAARSTMITVIGIMLGSAFTPAVVARMGEWWVTLLALAAWSLLAGGIALLYFRKVAGYDPITAFFSATPGGLNEMVIVGGQMGGDDRTISLTHAARIMLVVFTIPLWYRFGTDMPAGAARTGVGLFDLSFVDVMVLALCAPVGTIVGRMLRVPASFLVGPMVLSAAVHLAGITASKPPDVLVSVAQVVIGAAIGCRFAGVPLARIARTVLHAVVSAVMMLATTVAFAAVLSRWMDYPLPAVVLAFAPGGLAEMSLVALALAVDAAFVATHHIVRITMVVTFAPFLFRALRRKS